MFTALTLSLALGAPVPAPTPPVATGTAPRLMELKATADGKVVIQVTRTEKVQVGVGAAIAPGGNAAPPAVITREVPVSKMIELGEVKNLTVTTADGKKVSTEDAIKKIAGGAIVVVSGDGKPVSPAFLKVFKDDTLILASPELVGQQNLNLPVRPPIGRPGVIQPGIQILPIQPGNVQVLPIQGGAGGVIQIQVAPAVLPAPVPVPVDKTPQKNEK